MAHFDPEDDFSPIVSLSEIIGDSDGGSPANADSMQTYNGEMIRYNGDVEETK